MALFAAAAGCGLDIGGPPSQVPVVPTATPPANDTVPSEIETAARKFLAGELEVDEADLKLDSSEGVGWSDASLGCPQEGMMYAQVITPGYRLVFDLAGTSHAVHTNCRRFPHGGLRRGAVAHHGKQFAGRRRRVPVAESPAAVPEFGEKRGHPRMSVSGRTSIMRAAAIVAVVSLTCILACGGGEAEEKARALETARGWAEENTQTVVSEVVAFIASGIPGASLLDDLIAEQVVKLLTWEFSDPVKTGEGSYAVLATVSTSVELDLPVVGEKGYKASLPFNLRVDADAGEVTGWSPDVSQADVSEVE